MRTIILALLSLTCSLPLLGLTLGLERPIADPPTEVHWLYPNRMAIGSIGDQFAITWNDQRQVQLFSFLDDRGKTTTPSGVYVGGLPAQTLVASGSTYFVVGTNATQTSVVRVSRDGTVAGDPIVIEGELLAAAGGFERALVVVKQDGKRFAFFVSDAGALSGPMLVTETYFDDIVTVAGGSEGFLVAGLSKRDGRMWSRFVDYSQNVAVLPTLYTLPPAIDSAQLLGTTSGFLLTYGDFREQAAGCPAPQVSLRTATFDSHGALLRDTDTGLKYCITRHRSYSRATNGGGRNFYLFYGYAGHYWELHITELDSSGNRIGPVVPVADRKDDGSLIFASDERGRLALAYAGYPIGYRSWIADAFPLLSPPDRGNEVTWSAPPQYFRAAAAAPDGRWAAAWANDRAFNFTSDYPTPEWRVGRFGADGSPLDGTGIRLDLEPIAVSAPSSGTFDLFLKTPTDRVNYRFSLIRRRLLPDGTFAPDATIFSDGFRRLFEPLTLPDGTVVLPELRVKNKVSAIVVAPNGATTEIDVPGPSEDKSVITLNIAQSGADLVATWSDEYRCGIPEGCGFSPELWSLRFKKNGELIDPAPVRLSEGVYSSWVNALVSNGTETAAILYGVANQPREFLFRFDAARRAVDGGVPLWERASVQSLEATPAGFRAVIRDSEGWPSFASDEAWVVEFTAAEPLTTELLTARRKLLTTSRTATLVSLRGRDVLFYRRFSTEPKHGNTWQLFFADVFIPHVPARPANLRAAVNGNDVTLHWDDTSEDEEGVIIEFSRDGDRFSEVGRLSANATSAVIRYLGTGSWWFRVRSFNAEGPSEPSDAVRVEIAGRRRAVRRD